MKLNFRFYISWISCAILMFLLFYFWHGLVLNDFKRVKFPISWFITFAAFTYIIFGAGIYFLFESPVFKKIKSIFFRGILTGVIAGFSLFMIATVVNISLTKHLSMEHLLVDCLWQIAEQTLGAMVVVLYKIFIFDPEPDMILD
jgi:hypothetical protein